MGRIASGQLQERVTLLTPGPSIPEGNGYGNRPGPETATPLWARVRPLRGSERLNLGLVANEAAFEVTLRRRAGVSAKCRVTWQGVTYNVQAISAGESREYLLLTCFTSGK